MRRRHDIPPRPECQLFLPALSIGNTRTATANANTTTNTTTNATSTTSTTSRQHRQIQAELQRNLIRTKPIHLHVRFHAKSVIQQKPVIALLTVRIVNLLSPPNGLQRRDRETLRLLAERPLRLPRSQVIEHVGVRNQRRRPAAVDQQAEVTGAHDHARPPEFLEGGNAREFRCYGDDGIVVLPYGIGAIGYRPFFESYA
mmetsp:Transcript_10098/g.18429  ORF Transcript_10098/g.18429 Transcript_10098/m.18429 type:complete len:200 (+) Transcript_10098:136-735(+)